MAEYVYLIQEREFVVSKEQVYKLGKTTQTPGQRMANYPKSSEVHLYMIVKDCHTTEKCLIALFDSIFVQRGDYGREYYEGDINRMRREFIKCVSANYEHSSPKTEQTNRNEAAKVQPPKIRSFTAKLIEDNYHLYTDDMKSRGIKGLADFIELVATHEGQKSYVCTDVVKKKFARMINGEWQDDSKGVILKSIFRKAEYIEALWNLRTNLVQGIRNTSENARMVIDNKLDWIDYFITACRETSETPKQNKIIRDLLSELSFRLSDEH